MKQIFLKIPTIKTPMQLDSLTMQTYILGAIAGVVFLVIAILIAKAIKFEGGSNPKDPGKRRLWFWVLLFASFIAFFLYNMYFVTPTISPNLQSKFMTPNIIASSIALGVYFVVGQLLAFIFSTGKLGNWKLFSR